MTDIATKPDHGEILTGKDGRALTAFQLYLDDITQVLNSDRVILKPYTVAEVPNAASGYGMIMVTDEVGGPVPAFSDLSNWRRATDGVIVS